MKSHLPIFATEQICEGWQAINVIFLEFTGVTLMSPSRTLGSIKATWHQSPDATGLGNDAGKLGESHAFSVAVSKASSLPKSIAIFIIETCPMLLVLTTLKKLKNSWLTRLSSFRLYSEVINIYVYICVWIYAYIHMYVVLFIHVCMCVCIYMFSFIFFSIMVYHRIVNVVPSALQ